MVAQLCVGARRGMDSLVGLYRYSRPRIDSGRVGMGREPQTLTNTAYRAEMKSQSVAAFCFARPCRSFTRESDLLAAEARLVADHSTGAALALQAMAHGYAYWLTLDRKTKVAAARGGADARS